MQTFEILGQDVPNQLSGFEECNFSSELQANLSRDNIQSMKEIQKHIFGAALAERDVFILAPSASGTTTAFITFAADYVMRKRTSIKEGEIICLILSPSKERCMQIEKKLKSVCFGLNIQSVLLVGGVPMPPQRAKIEKGAQVFPKKLKLMKDYRRHTGSFVGHRFEI